MWDRTAEKQKWDKYYGNLPLVEVNGDDPAYYSDLIDRITAMLPEGDRILEAGCGGGGFSLALARSGRFRTTLLDFSHEALSHARQAFQNENLPATFLEADIACPGSPDFDLVFNAGVLEHYDFDEQLAVLRGMASRTRRYVLVVVPNSRCYWYWIWRLRLSSAGQWPWGKEIPRATLADLLSAAGIHVLGEAHVGRAWTESFLSQIPELDRSLAEDIVAIHRSSAVPADQSSYLLATLGSVDPHAPVPPGWTPPAFLPDSSEPLRAAIVDALAARNSSAGELVRMNQQVAEIESALNEEFHESDRERARSLQERRSLIATIDGLAAQLAEYHKEHKVEKRNVDGLRAAIAEGERRVAELTAKVASAAADNRLLVEKGDRLAAELSSAIRRGDDSLAQSQGTNAALEDANRTLQSAYRESCARSDSLATELEASRAAATETISRLSDDLRAARVQLGESALRADGLAHELDEARAALAARTEECFRTQRELIAARQDAEALQGECRQLQSREESLGKELDLARVEAQEHFSESERLNGVLSALRSSYEAVASRERQAQSRGAQLANELDESRAEIAGLRGSVEALDVRYRESVSIAENLRRELEEAGREAACASGHCRRLNGEISLLRGEIEAAAAREQQLLAEADRLANDLRESRALVGGLRARRDQAVEERVEAERAAQAAESGLAQARAECSRLAEEAAELTSTLRRRGAEIADLEASISRERSLTTRSEREFSEFRRCVTESSASFSKDFEGRIHTLRGQRAWRVMLATRKAYSLWVRGGWRGRLASLGVPFELIAGKTGAFSGHDVSFPEIWSYLPDLTAQVPGPEGLYDDRMQHRRQDRKYDVLILPVFNFEFRFQRPQQIACEFARSGHRVFWVSPSRPPSKTDQRWETVLLRENLWEVRLDAAPLDIYTSSLSPEKSRRLADGLQDVFREFALAETAAIVQFPFWRQVALDLRERFASRVVYDCMDDWHAWTAAPRVSGFSLAEEAKLAVESDVAIATSAALANRLEKQGGRKVMRIRNAADCDHFAAAPDNTLLSKVSHPIVGYYGAIADWFDVDLLAELAACRPQYSFVIIGEVHERDVSRLRCLPNVSLLGEKHYRVIPSYLRHFDVCLLPFIPNDLTRAVDPVKVYEYLSQGKPVVATSLPELRDCGDLLYLATGSAEFKAQLDRAVAEDSPALQNARRSFAEANAWKSRVQCLDRALVDTWPLVSLVVVSFSSEEFLGPFLDSVRRNTSCPRYEVIVVDNNSADHSRDLLLSHATRDSRIHPVLLDENRGFAGGTNVGVRQARGEYLIVINPDTIVTPGWTERLLRPVRAHPDIGMAAPVTNFSGNETRVNCSYRRLPEMEDFARELAIRNFGQLTTLSMAPLLCAVIPKKVWNEVGELDESFGVGMFEDDDYSLRMRKAGYRIVAVDDCFIHHFGNGSFGKLDPAESLKVYNTNLARFEEKWATKWHGHQRRPGVNPVTDADRTSVTEFFAARSTPRTDFRALRLKRLFPDRIHTGERVNVQPDGVCAIVVECENAAPCTVIQFGQTLLQTSYGSDRLLSALLPPDFNKTPAKVVVQLVDDIGRSNALTFAVEA